MRQKVTKERIAYIREESAKLIAGGYKPYHFFVRFGLAYSVFNQIINGTYEKELEKRKLFNRVRRANGK